MASVHVEASPFSSHEAHLGFCQSQERGQPGLQTKSSFYFHQTQIESSEEAPLM